MDFVLNRGRLLSRIFRVFDYRYVLGEKWLGFEGVKSIGEKSLDIFSKKSGLFAEKV